MRETQYQKPTILILAFGCLVTAFCFYEMCTSCWSGFQYVAKVGLETSILLTLLAKHLPYRFELLYLAFVHKSLIGIESCKNYVASHFLFSRCKTVSRIFSLHVQQQRSSVIIQINSHFLFFPL